MPASIAGGRQPDRETQHADYNPGRRRRDQRVGLARCHSRGSETDEVLARVQNDLFDLGADVTRPGDDHADGSLRVQPDQIERLEREIDDANDGLDPLKSFVLRGGIGLSAGLHFACTVCRRAERAADSARGGGSGEPARTEIHQPTLRSVCSCASSQRQPRLGRSLGAENARLKAPGNV